MTNKKILVLLMTASLAFQQTVRAEDIVIPLPDTTTIKEKVSDTVSAAATAVENKADDAADAVSNAITSARDAVADATEATEAPTLSAAHVTALRCVGFFVAKNTLRAIMKASYGKGRGWSDSYAKVGQFSAEDYLGHFVSYGIDVAAPYSSTDKATNGMKAAEFLAKEISIIGKEDDTTDSTLSTSSLRSKQAWAKMFFKALNRNKLFILPEQAKAVLKNDLVSMTTGMLEGLTVFAKDNSMTYNANKCAGSFIYGQVAMRSNSLAKEILAYLMMTGKMPEALDKFTNTPEGMTLVENLLAQLIENSVNQGFKATQLHG